MARRWMMLLGALAALMIAGAPVRAQDNRSQQPYPFKAGIPPRAQIDKPADEVARETAAADAADAACQSGDAAGCAALGQAYAYGSGRPQVRQIAEIVLRRACTAGSGNGCTGLGDLVRGRDDDVSWPEAVEAFERACALGEGQTCRNLADWLADTEDAEDRAMAARLAISACKLGVPAGCQYPPPSRALVERQLLKDCDSGTGESCRTLAAGLLEDGRSERDRTRGLGLLDRQCRGKDAAACAVAADVWRAAEQGDGPRTSEYLALGCTAGDNPVCAALGKAAFGKTPPDRTAAIGFFERACALDPGACLQASDLREEPLLTARCESGEQNACVTLGEMLYRWDGVLLDRERAIAVLEATCQAGTLGACRSAAEYIQMGSIEQDHSIKAQRALALLTRGCDGGNREACERLADQLEFGQFLPRDIDRALSLYVPQCDDERSSACDKLVEYNHPAAPALLAIGFDPPDRTPEEIAAEERAKDEARERDDAAFRAYVCTTATATFEGATYFDTMCLNIARSIGGFAVPRIEQAPWQALLWRPERLGTQAVAPEYRAECGGAVIATGWILTAAHCLVDHVDTRNRYPIEKHGYRVRLGVIRPLENEGNSYPILGVIPHPLFVRKTLEFDIALVRYDPKAGTRGTSGFGMARIQLDTRSLAERQVVAKAPVFSFGWGRTALNRPQAAEVLQGVRLELRDAQECTKVTGFLDKRRDSVLCAAGPKGEQACFGDSGGPLITYGDEQGVPTLIGVVSGGVKCGTTGTPSRYTRVGHPLVQAWLVSHLPGFKTGGVRSGQTAR